jgi:hypothetical protein
MAKEYYKGIYEVQNKEKFIGEKKLIYKSSWECRCMYFLDHNPNIIRWSYEAIEIPYYSPITRNFHRYYPDFYVELKDKSGMLKKFIFEVKPEKQTKSPKPLKNRKISKSHIYDAHEFVKNQCKWQATKLYCEKLGYEFKLITENELFPK